jgi:ribosomal protein L37E
MKRKPPPVLLCRACDARIEAHWNYCSHCGFALEPMVSIQRGQQRS